MLVLAVVVHLGVVVADLLLVADFLDLQDMLVVALVVKLGFLLQLVVW